MTKQHSNRGRNIGFVVGVFVASFTAAWLYDSGCRDGSRLQADSDSANRFAFWTIGNAHDEDFAGSASRTRAALATVEDVINRTRGASLDPRIRQFANQQAEYEQAMSRFVATEREAFDHPERVPLDLWQLQLRYHQTAHRLAMEYAPDWAAGLQTRIEHDEKIIRRFSE